MARRTRLCQFHIRGCCERGPRCTFAHGVGELGSVRPARDWDSGKEGLCKFFQEGRCRRGDLCEWAHGTHQLRQEEQSKIKKQEEADIKKQEEAAIKKQGEAAIKRQEEELVVTHRNNTSKPPIKVLK